MTVQLDVSVGEGFSEEVLDLVLERAEQALVDADCREDEPFVRITGGIEPELESFRAALIDVSHAFPGASFELGAICDRLREVGTQAALRELDAHPHLVQVVRLSLEIFFRRFPTPSDFELGLADEQEEESDLGVSAADLWRAHHALLTALRQTLH